MKKYNDKMMNFVSVQQTSPIQVAFDQVLWTDFFPNIFFLYKI